MFVISLAVRHFLPIPTRSVIPTGVLGFFGWEGAKISPSVLDVEADGSGQENARR